MRDFLWPPQKSLTFLTGKSQPQSSFLDTWLEVGLKTYVFKIDNPAYPNKKKIRRPCIILGKFVVYYYMMNEPHLETM